MKWCTLAPLEYDGDLDVPFDLGNNVVLCARPDWLIQRDIVSGLGDQDRTHLEVSKYVLMQEYDANALGDRDPAWTGDTPRSKQQAAEEALNLANTALWIAKPCPVGFKRVVVANLRAGIWIRIRFGVSTPLCVHRFDLYKEYNSLELHTARGLNCALMALTRRETIWIASRALWLALLTREWTIRYLLLWTALEALFGPEDGREITYRLSQRVAFFLVGKGAEASKAFESIKKGYEWRSRVVHGMRLGKLKPELSERIMHESEALVRDSLKRILADSRLIKQFNGRTRENYLDGLPFS
jgi:hypothetical protein